MGKECHCGDCNDEKEINTEEMTTDEIVDSNHLMIHALVDLLIEKKVITEEEYKNKIDSMCDETEDEK